MAADGTSRARVHSYSSIGKFLARWRDHEPELKPKSRPPASVSLRQQAGGHPTVSGQISPLVAPALLSKPRPLLTGWQAAKVEALKKACPDFARMRSVVLSFRGILQCGKAATLARWMKKAVASGIYGRKRFVRKLNHDLAAVKNALRESWSNGSGGGSHQSAEDAQAPDVWSSRIRTLTSPIAAGVSWLPAARKVRKNP